MSFFYDLQLNRYKNCNSTGIKIVPYWYQFLWLSKVLFCALLTKSEQKLVAMKKDGKAAL